MLDELSECALNVDGIYGGGREAYMEGSTQLEMGCVTGMAEIYGGSEKADVGSNVELTITSGHFHKVFGGNNKGGRINGSITVNIEQTGCVPITIDELYLGGNNAPYSVYGYNNTTTTVDVGGGEMVTHYGLNESGQNPYPDPRLNIRSFQTIGTVYGGGNGSYAYTDNPNLAGHDYYRDFYYDKTGFSSSAEALNAFRPNAQQAWIHVEGTQNKPTLIGGSLYCGGNSATLNITQGDTTKTAELNIGSYVIVDNVFLGSNGANMIDDDMIEFYHEGMVGGWQRTVQLHEYDQ